MAIILSWRLRGIVPSWEELDLGPVELRPSLSEDLVASASRTTTFFFVGFNPVERLEGAADKTADESGF